MRTVSILCTCLGLGVYHATVSVGDAAAEDATSFVEPSLWAVGQAGSTYQEWDIFSRRTGNAPDVGHYPVGFSPTFSAAPAAILTGTGNLYSFAGDYDWWAEIEQQGASSGATHVMVQTATTLNDGVGVYPESLRIMQLDGTQILGGDSASVLRETVLFEGEVWVEAMGQYVTQQERLWEFVLPDWRGDFRVNGRSRIHSGFWQLRADSMIAQVPEPSSLALAAAGALVLALACKVGRKRRSLKGFVSREANP